MKYVVVVLGDDSEAVLVLVFFVATLPNEFTKGIWQLNTAKAVAAVAMADRVVRWRLSDRLRGCSQLVVVEVICLVCFLYCKSLSGCV